MNKLWQDFMHGQELASETSSEGQARIVDLSWRSQISVSGADATEFLHGQFSNDLKALDGSNQQLSSYSTPKGRILALFRITRLNNDYVLDCPSDVADAFIKRLSMFVMRSDVTIKNMDEERAMLGIYGNQAGEILRSMSLQVPEQENAVSYDSDSALLVAAIPGLVPRYAVSAPIEALKNAWLKILSAGAQVGNDTDWRLGSIEAGQPEVYSETSESFVAQMINLQIINGINFKKGCYPGQEVIARLQYLGKLKRKMYLLESDAESTVNPGDPVFTDDSKEPAGEVVDAAKTTSGKYRLLAVLKTASVEAGSVLRVTASEGPGLHMLELPYSLEEG